MRNTLRKCRRPMLRLPQGARCSSKIDGPARSLPSSVHRTEGRAAAGSAGGSQDTPPASPRSAFQLCVCPPVGRVLDKHCTSDTPECPSITAIEFFASQAVPSPEVVVRPVSARWNGMSRATAPRRSRASFTVVIARTNPRSGSSRGMTRWLRKCYVASPVLRSLSARTRKVSSRSMRRLCRTFGTEHR